MTVPTPPPITPPKPPPPSQWWADGYDTTITRHEFLARWRVEVMTIVPRDGKAFQDEMDAWCGDLHTVDWIGSEYHPQAPYLLGHPSEPIASTEGWDAVSEIVASFVEPLCEYTSGWSRSIQDIRPRVRSDVGREIREIGRFVARRMRDDLVASGVVDTSAGLREFIRDQRPHHPRHICVALTFYIRRLSRLVEGLAIQRDPADTSLRADLGRHYLDVAASFDARCGGEQFDTGSQAADPRRRGAGHARNKSNAIVTDRLHGWTSILGDGQSPADALINDQLRDFARIRISRDRTQRRAGGDDLWWEAQLALRILDRPEDVESGIEATVRAAWGDERPATARSINADAAVRDVELQIRAAINHAKRLGGR